ncbi:preprotein translocase SecA [Streptomyces albiflavescens]|uniref:Preprotein translocase SecA n=1 Tax=Streptomyces albiflavescens TaxID=1623582 RepID=A0A917Y222_9ACTN|nr:tetratricopeptide repeat protein [Streptomyces albiflavescens]GGN64552.1 preprotein translocase SecA [Streptomyces albiflavescens]
MSRKRRRTPHQPAPAERTYATQAEELEALAREYPEDREEILVEAAGSWNDAEEYDRALALYQQLLDTKCEDPHLIEAYRISTLWDAGRADQAREAAGRLRRQHPTDPGAWNFVAEAFETAGELRDAADWFTAGITHLLGPATPLTPSAVEHASDPSGIEMLVIGRHRVRRRLTQPHDALDTLADDLHEHRPSLLRGSSTLDDLHDPDRLRAAESGDEDALQAEFDKLTAEVTARRAALSRPRMTCALFWPETEFTQLLARWPALADHYGAEHHEHIRLTEELLHRRSGDGEPHLGIARGTMADFEAFTRDEDLPHRTATPGPDTPPISPPAARPRHGPHPATAPAGAAPPANTRSAAATPL